MVPHKRARQTLPLDIAGGGPGSRSSRDGGSRIDPRDLYAHLELTGGHWLSPQAPSHKARRSCASLVTDQPTKITCLQVFCLR